MPDATVAGKPFRVLSLDGGGMRGTYTATYLACVADGFARRRNVESLDIGRAFDLIVGTSTGGIIACALAAGVSLRQVVALYREHGPSIFPLRLPAGSGPRLYVELCRQLKSRPAALASGNESLRAALDGRFGDLTLSKVYEDRGVALAITAVEMSQHRSWVFKTPHLPRSNARDNDYKLVDVCLATSAAPIFRSMAVVDHPTGDGFNVFVDGGLWANNPVMVGLIEALEMAPLERTIQVFSIGTCPEPAGERVGRDAVNRGLREWKFGGDAASLSVSAQEFAFDNMARMLTHHLNRPCEFVRFPRDPVPAALLPFLGLDDTREEATAALIDQARTDANMTNSRCGDPNHREGRLICELFNEAPAAVPPLAMGSPRSLN